MYDYQEIFDQALVEINFSSRYKAISSSHNELDNDKLMKNISRKAVIHALKVAGLNAKTFPGNGYDIREESDELTFQLYINIKGGMLTNYLGVMLNGNLINDVNRKYNFAFIYRYLVGDSNAAITAPKFTTQNELIEIIQQISSIFEDFKRTFMKKLKK